MHYSQTNVPNLSPFFFLTVFCCYFAFGTTDISTYNLLCYARVSLVKSGIPFCMLVRQWTPYTRVGCSGLAHDYLFVRTLQIKRTSV